MFSNSGYLTYFRSANDWICNTNCNSNDCKGHRKYWHLFCDQSQYKFAISNVNDGDASGCYGCDTCRSASQVLTRTYQSNCRDFDYAYDEDHYCCYHCTNGPYQYGSDDYSSYGQNGQCYHSTRRICSDWQYYVPATPGTRRAVHRAEKTSGGSGVWYPSHGWQTTPSGGSDNNCRWCPAGQQRSGSSAQSRSCAWCPTRYFRAGSYSQHKCVVNRRCEDYGAAFVTHELIATRGTDTNSRLYNARTLPDVCKCALNYHSPDYNTLISSNGLTVKNDNDQLWWYSTIFNGGAVSTSACVRCPPGTYTTAAGYQTCQTLATDWAGKYYNVAERDNVEKGVAKCPAGTYQPYNEVNAYFEQFSEDFFERGIGVCQDCKKGTYSDGVIGADRCDPCLDGTYQDEMGQPSCKLALEGRYADGTALEIDAPCGVGTYDNTQGNQLCTNTQPGQYQDGEGKLTYKTCSGNTYCSREKCRECLSHTGCLWADGNGIYDSITAEAGVTGDFTTYALAYAVWLRFTTDSISEAKPGSTKHDTICQCNPGFYFDGTRIGYLVEEEIPDHDAYVAHMETQPIPTRIPCWPVPPGTYTDTLNAVELKNHRSCEDAGISVKSLTSYGVPGSSTEQNRCQCKKGYYRIGEGTDIQFDDAGSISSCTQADATSKYVPEDGCDGGTGCLLTVHTCTGTGLVQQTPATTTADVICRCNKGYYRSTGGTDLTYTDSCTRADITLHRYVDDFGQFRPKVSQQCLEDLNHHVEDVALTIDTPRKCKCAIGSYRPTQAKGLTAPWKYRLHDPLSDVMDEYACITPGEVNGVKQGFVDETGQTEFQPYADCAPSTVNHGVLSYEHQRKCECDRGYYRTAVGSGFYALVLVNGEYQPTTCTASGVGNIVPNYGSTSADSCGPDTMVAAGLQPGFCPSEVNYEAILYPTCYDSQSRPTVAALDSTRTDSSPGKCRCRRGYYKTGDGNSFNYFKENGDLLDTGDLPVCTAASQGYKVPNDGSKSQTACIDEENYQPKTGQTMCETLPDCPESTVNDTANTNTIRGRRCQCAIGYYDTTSDGGNNLQPSYVCQRPCYDNPPTITCRKYLPPGVLGANIGDLVQTTPCNEGTNLVLQTDRTYTSGYICKCNPDSYRTEGYSNLLADTHTCTLHEACASGSVQKIGPTNLAQRTCRCDSDSYNTAIGDGFDAPGTNNCQPRSECASVTTVKIDAGSPTSNTRCECASGYYNENTGSDFEAPGNNVCESKGSCVTPSTKVHVEGGPTIDRTCQCKSGYYHLGSHLDLAPGTSCYEQNTCDQTSSSTEQVATATSDAQCTCNTGYFREAGDTFFITTCPDPDACQEQSCTEVGTCSSSAIQFGDLTGTADIECQCAPGYFRVEGGTGFASGTTCQEADYDNGQYVPDAGSSSPETMSPCPDSTEQDWGGNITAERTCRCKPGFYRPNIASSLPTSLNCLAVGEGYFTAFHGATEQEPRVACPTSTIEFAPPTSTSQRRCQCDRGYYKSGGGTNLLVNETCTAATSGWFVAEIGSITEEIWNSCGPSLVEQNEPTATSNIVCECALQHYATEWSDLAWNDSCTERGVCEGSLTYMMVDGAVVIPPGDSDNVCMCAEGFYLPDPFNLPPTATCLQSGECQNTLQEYQPGDIENPTLCKCAPGYYVDLVTHHRKHVLMELTFESGSSVQDSSLGHVFTLNSLIDLANPTPASFTTGRVGQYSLDISGNEIYYLSQNHNFYREGIDGITLSFHVNLNSATMMQLVMDLSAFRVVLVPSVNTILKVEYSGGTLNVGLPGLTFEVGVWHHFAVVFDYSTQLVKGYINGSYVASVRDWGLNYAFLSSGPISIGGRYGDDAYKSFDGKLDDVRFFSDVLTESEIGTLANYKQKDVFLDIPTDKSWFSGLPSTSECALMSTCHSSAVSMWPDPANPTDFDTFGDTLCTCKPGFYRSLFASNFDSLTECIEPPSGFFVAEKNQTTFEAWGECGVGAEVLVDGTTTTRPTCQCRAGYYRPEGGYDFDVNLDCTAASHLYYVPEEGSSTQLVCPDGTQNIGTANTECGPCLLYDHFAYCWEPYTTVLQTADEVIRTDEVRVSFDGQLRSGPHIQPFCDFIDFRSDTYTCLKFPNCPKQGVCNLETLNFSSDLPCDRITGATKCSEVEPVVQTYHPLFLVQTYDLHHCTGNPSCPQFRIDPLLCPECGVFCPTAYLAKKDFTDSSPGYDPTVMSYDEYLLHFTSLDCAELPYHPFLGAGSDFITLGNEFLHYWDTKWRGLSNDFFSTVALAGTNLTIDWVRASNPRIQIEHFWGDRQTGLEVSIGSILIRLLGDKVQLLKQDATSIVLWERTISHLDTKTLVNTGISKTLFKTDDITDGSFCSTLYQDGSCSATWTQLKMLSTLPIQFITSHIRPQDTSPTDTLKISFWDGEVYDLPLNLSEFISLATQNSYRDNVEYPSPLKRYTMRTSLRSPVLDRRILPPKSQDTSQYLCKESTLDNPTTTPVGAWLLQYYLMTDNVFTNFTRSYSGEIHRSLSGLVLDASNGLVIMASNVYPNSIVALSQSLQCGNNEKSTLSQLFGKLEDVYTSTSVSMNSQLMSEGAFYLNASLDRPDYYLQYRRIVNEQLNELESTSTFLVSRMYSVYPKTNYTYRTGEFFIWRDVSTVYPGFDLGVGARPSTLGSVHHFRSFTPHFLSIEGSNIKQAFLYYRQAECSTGNRDDCIIDSTRWLTPEEQSEKGWEIWYYIFDDGSLETLKIPLPLLPIDVYEVALQVISLKTFRPNQNLYRDALSYLGGSAYYETQDAGRYRHSKLWSQLSIQKDIVLASDYFDEGVFDSNLDLSAHYVPSDTFVRFETGEVATSTGFTFCMTYYPLTSEEPIFRVQGRTLKMKSGLPVNLADGTESVLGYYTGAWDVVAQRARGDTLQKLTCICYLSSGDVFLNGLSISDRSTDTPTRVFLGDRIDVGTTTYEPTLAIAPQGILLYATSFWPNALDRDAVMNYQTDELTKHSATVVKSPLFDSFYAERHIRISALAEDEVSKPFYHRNFIHDVSISHIDLTLNSADFEPKVVTENCEANGYECTFLYTRFDSSIPPLCVDGVDSSMYAPLESYGTCSSQHGIFSRHGMNFISNDEDLAFYRIYDGFRGENNGLLLITDLVINVNSLSLPDFDSEVIHSNTLDFSVSRFDKETLTVRACGKRVNFHIPASGAAFKAQVKVSVSEGGDILVFWWDGQPTETFYFTRKYEENPQFAGYEKCTLSKGRFQMFRTPKRSNIGISSFYAMSPYPTKSVSGVEMVDRHLQSFHISGPNCGKKCVVHNQDPNTITVDGEVVADIGKRRIRLLSKTHKNWALASDSYFGFVVRADVSFDTTGVSNVDFLNMQVTLPFAHLVEVQQSTVLETVFLTVSGTYDTLPNLQVELRGGTPPFDRFRSRGIYSENRTFHGVPNQRNLQVEVKIRGNTFMLYLDGEERYTMPIGKRFPLSEFVIVSNKPYKFEDDLYEYTDFVILTKAHENCACRSDCDVGTFASDARCLPCPENTLTFSRGATSIDECVCKSLHKKNESGLCAPIPLSSTALSTPGYCAASSCALRSFMVGEQSGCSCTDDCFVQSIVGTVLPCCANKCSTCPPSKTSAEGEFFSRHCQCEYDASQGIAVNRAGTTGCSGFVCGPGFEPLDGHCSACVENFYKVGVNLDMCVACEPCPEGYFRDGCQGSSSGVCLPCSTCGTEEKVLQQCGNFSDTLCFDTTCDTTPPTSHLLGPFGLLVISSQAGCIISPENRRLECWGESQYWDGLYTKESMLAVPMHSYMQPVDVQMGDNFICLLSLSGYVQCAGSNANGRLGMGLDVVFQELTDLENTTPIDFGNNTFIVSMAVGSLHTCVLSDIGTVLCFGLNNHMQLGRAIGSNIQTPADIGSAQTVLQVSCGIDYSCVRLQSGGVKCFGNWQNPGSGSLNRQLFLGDNLPELELGTFSFAVDVQASGSHTCVRFEDKTVKCFGQSGNYLGFDVSGETSFGLSTQTMGANLPVLFGEQTPIIQMALTPDSSCFLTADQRVICVGSSLLTGYYNSAPPHNNMLTGSIQENWYLNFGDERILSIFAFDEGEKNCAYTSTNKIYCWTLLLPSVVLQLDLPTELCAAGDYSTQCRTNDVYRLLFSRGFLTRRSPLGRKTAEEYGILTSCRQCTSSVEQCGEGFYLSDKCDTSQTPFKDNTCLSCSKFRCSDPSKFLQDGYCGVLTQNSTRFADSIECTGVCSRQEDSYLKRGCNVLQP